MICTEIIRLILIKLVLYHTFQNSLPLLLEICQVVEDIKKEQSDQKKTNETNAKLDDVLKKCKMYELFILSKNDLITIY